MQACTIVFLLEVSLRALAHGPLPFCRDPFNAFDAAMFVMALVDFGTSGRVIHNVASMRTFRVLRVFQLAGQWPSLAIFLSSVFSALRAVRPFAFLLLLFILVSALLGMQILAGKLSFPDGEPRSNYDNFFWACLTTFQVTAAVYPISRSHDNPVSSFFLHRRDNIELESIKETVLEDARIRG